MSTDVVHGFQGTWAFVDSNANPSTSTIDELTQTFPVVTDNLGLEEDYGYSQGNRGNRTEVAEASWLETEAFDGTMVLEASPKVLGFFLRHMTGDATSPHTMGDSLGNGFDYARYDGSNIKVYRNVQISRWVLTASSGGPATLTLSLVGLNEERDFTSFTFKALDTTSEYAPYIAHEIVLNGGDAAADRDIDDFTLTIDHRLEARRRFNTSPQCYVFAGPRQTRFTSTTPWNSTAEAELYGYAQAGLGATVTMTRSTMSTVISLTRLQVPRNTPGITTQGETSYPITAMVRGTGSTSELSIAHDDTL